MAKEFIVAIELGSSKMTGIAGKKNPDGSITVLAVAKEDASSCIRKGCVYNIDKTAQCLTNIVTKLKTSLKNEIEQVYVCIGGQSIHGVRNVINKDLPLDAIVTQDVVNELMDANRSMTYPDYMILDAATLEYKVDNQLQVDPVGIQASHIEANFVNILWRKLFANRLKKSFDTAGIRVAETPSSAIVLADAVLTETEKRAGCLLVDLGADTTTVAVYHRDILRHLAVIPLGGNNITKDIASLPTEEHVAENMKLQYASAFTDVANIDATLSYPIGNDRQVESSKFIQIVEARVDEIIENVWRQVPNELLSNLLGGIVLTGGGSNMPNIEKAFTEHTGIQKIRIAKFPTLTINTSSQKLTLPHDGTLNTILGLLAYGNINCAGVEVGKTLFPEEKPSQPAASSTSTSSTTSNKEAERPETTDKPTDQSKTTEPSTPEAEEENHPTKPSFFGRMKGAFGKFVNTITEPDGNE